MLLRADRVYTFDPGGQPRAWRGPLYPAFLALAQAGSDSPSPRRAYLAQAVFSLSAAAAAGWLGAFLLSPAAGALAAAGLSLDPALAGSVVGLDAHGFYGLIVLLIGAAAAFWAQREGDRLSGNLLGLAVGAGFLCRSAHAAALPLLAAAALAWWGRDGLLRIGRVLLVAAAVTAPWAARNYVHFGRFVPMDAGVATYNLLAAADDRDQAVTVETAFDVAELHDPGFTARYREQASDRREAGLRAVALRLILGDPARYLRGCWRRALLLWRPLWPLVLLSAIAVFRPNAGRGARAAALIACSFAAYAALGQSPGYRLEVEPLLVVLAAVGAASLIPAARTPREAVPARALAPAAAILALSLLAFLAFLPFDALAARRAGQPACEPPSPFLLRFLDDGAAACGTDWPLATWSGRLRARPEVCAGMKAYGANDDGAAVGHFAAAAALAPDDPEIRLSLSVALAGSGKKERARSECARAWALTRTDLSSTQDQLRAAIARTCESLGSKAAAAARSSP